MEQLAESLGVSSACLGEEPGQVGLLRIEHGEVLLPGKAPGERLRGRGKPKEFRFCTKSACRTSEARSPGATVWLVQQCRRVPLLACPAVPLRPQSSRRVIGTRTANDSSSRVAGCHCLACPAVPPGATA